MKRAAFTLLLCSACTTLGPMPATTGISATPIGRPGVEAQFSAVPGFYASQAATNSVDSRSINAGTFLLDPDAWLGVKGLLFGGRLFGKDDDTPFEPFVGYRRKLIDNVSLGGIVFGSTKRAGSMTEAPGATYHGVRFGGEAMVDAIVWEPNKVFRVDLQGAVSLTRILASGTYCVDDMGVGIDCEDPSQGTAQNTVIAGKFVGVFPAATGGIGLDFGRREGVFHNARLALLGTVGRMPLVLGGEENGTGTYFQLGFSLAVQLGLGRGDAQQSE